MTVWRQRLYSSEFSWHPADWLSVTEHDMQGSTLDMKPSDLDTKGRLINIGAADINIIMNSAVIRG